MKKLIASIIVALSLLASTAQADMFDGKILPNIKQAFKQNVRAIQGNYRMAGYQAIASRIGYGGSMNPVTPRWMNQTIYAPLTGLPNHNQPVKTLTYNQKYNVNPSYIVKPAYTVNPSYQAQPAYNVPRINRISIETDLRPVMINGIEYVLFEGRYIPVNND